MKESAVTWTAALNYSRQLLSITEVLAKTTIKPILQAGEKKAWKKKSNLQAGEKKKKNYNKKTANPAISQQKKQPG